MISLLTNIVSSIVCWIETGAVLFANFLIATVAAAISFVINLLPNVPTFGSMPTWVTNGANFAGYWMDLNYMFTVLLPLALSMILAWFVLAIALRWFRAISGNN